MARVCKQCGKALTQKNPANLCFACQEKRREQDITANEELIDAEEFAFILGLKNAESVKRKARKGELPPRIPGIRKCQWYRKDIDAWIKEKQEEESRLRSLARNHARKPAGNIARKREVTRNFRRIAVGVASNLRRCSNDNIIRAISDTPGKKAYGQEHVLGNTEAGRVEPIKLVKVPIATAKRMLQQLPEKDFPELKGITDWGKLPYDRIHEAFLVRLESYF